VLLSAHKSGKVDTSSVNEQVQQAKRESSPWTVERLREVAQVPRLRITLEGLVMHASSAWLCCRIM
jgi:hypothetical protein